jgi:hypothetical protein
MMGSLWVHTRHFKEAFVVEMTSDYVGFVYDRVDDPLGPTSQYGIQRLPWDVFTITHRLKDMSPRVVDHSPRMSM